MPIFIENTISQTIVADRNIFGPCPIDSYHLLLSPSTKIHRQSHQQKQLLFSLRVEKFFRVGSIGGSCFVKTNPFGLAALDD